MDVPALNNGTDLSHELLGGHDQLVVDEPSRLLLKQRTAGVDVDRLLMLHRPVSSFAQPRSVVEVACRHRLDKKNKKKLIHSKDKSFIST